MPRHDIYSIMLKTFQNPTKMSIIFLLTENRKMTVTQMSRQVKVTKANLYHFVGEMVRDGLLSKPEIRVKKNYVEKYYSLNEAAFKSVDPEETEKRLSGAKPEDYRALLQSFLASLGLSFRLFAEQVARADDEKLAAIASAFKQQKIMLHYSVLVDASYDYELKEIERMLKKSTKRWGQESGLQSGNKLIIVGFPRFETSSNRAQEDSSAPA